MTGKTDKEIREEIGPQNFDNIQMLHQELEKEDARPNVMDVGLFRKFAPLFNADTEMNIPVLRELSKEFYFTVDIYKPIQVVEGGKVLFTLPAILVPTADMKKEFAHFIDVNAKHLDSNVPKYRDGAFFDMVNKFMESQADDENIDRIIKQQQEFGQVLQQFSDQTGLPMPAKKEGVNDAPSVEVSGDGSGVITDLEED